MVGSKIRVLIVEDEGLMRDMLRISLSAYPNLEVVGAVGDGESAVKAAEELAPDVVLTDIELGDGPSGIEAGHRIKARQPRIGIVILSFHQEKQYIASLPASKASGWSYLLKQSVADTEALTRAIEGSAGGFVVLVPAIVEGLRPAANSPVEHLTVRQREVLELMAQGYSNAAIAERLSVSEKSVENYINAIFQELGITREDPVHPRVKAVLTYLQQTRSR
jgi:DNA-binding NarL/FixJ family response regulator